MTFEKYNERARRALFFARYEASKLGGLVIEAEHVLLGILREHEGVLTDLFARFDVEPEDIRQEIEAERVLLANRREQEGVLADLFARLGVKPEDIRQEIEAERNFPVPVPPTAELPLSDETTKVFVYASHEAESLEHRAVGLEHLLIGMLRVDSSLANQVLTRAGLDLDVVREAVAA